MATPPVTIAAGPPVPDSSDPENEFDAHFEAFLAWQKNELQPKANAQAQGVYDNTVLVEQALEGANEASDAAGDAAAAAITAAASALGAPGTNSTSSSTLAMALGAGSLVTQTGKIYPNGANIVIARTSDPGTQMGAVVLSYNPANGAMNYTVGVKTGSGTYNDWTISIGLSAGASLPGMSGADVGKLVAVGPGPSYILIAGRGAGAATPTGNTTLTAASGAAQKITPTGTGQWVQLPDATTMAVGMPVYMLSNAGAFDLAIRNAAGTVLGFIRAGGAATVGLADISTAAGVWTIEGALLHGVMAQTELAFALTLGSSNTGALRSVVALDANRDLLFFSGDARLYAVVWDGAGSTFGTPVLMRAATFSATVNLLAIKSATDQALCVSFDSTTGMQAVALSISGMTITVNTAASATLGGNIDRVHEIIPVVGQGFVAAYGRATNVNAARVITISGTTVTIGAEATLPGNTIGTGIPVCLFDAGSSRVLAFSSSGTTHYATPYTVAGTTLTVGTGASVVATSSQYWVRALASGRWALLLVDTTVKGSIVSLSSTTATISTVNLSAAGNSPSAVRAIGSQVLMACNVSGGSPLNINVLTDNAGTAVAGTELTRNGSSYINLLGADATSMWITNTPSSGLVGQFFRVGITGNNAVVLSARGMSSVTQDVGGLPVPGQPLGAGGANTGFYGKAMLPPGVLQGTQISLAGLTTFAHMYTCTAGGVMPEPRVPWLDVNGSSTFGNLFTRSASLGSLWAGQLTNAGLNMIVQKYGVA